MTARTINLHTGLDVLIQRTDGRVHPAKISEIRLETQSACVEWRERNETKGKEILLESILDLNPLLKTEDRPSSFTFPSTVDTNEGCGPSEPDKESVPSTDIKSPSSELASTVEHITNQNGGTDPQQSKTHHRKTSKTIERITNCRRTIMVGQSLRPRSCTSSNLSNESFDNGQLPLPANGMTNATYTSTEKAELRKSLTNIDDLRSRRKRDIATSKSNCLKEIQRIALNRQQRRIEHQEAMRQRSAVLESQTNRISRDYVSSSDKQQPVQLPTGTVATIGDRGGMMQKRTLEFRTMINRYRKRLESRAKKMNYCPITDSPMSSSSSSARLRTRILSSTSSTDGSAKRVLLRDSADQLPNIQTTDTIIARTDNRITVSVRKRPINTREDIRGELDIVSILGQNICIIHSPREKVDLTKYLDNHQFRFD